MSLLGVGYVKWHIPITLPPPFKNFHTELELNNIGVRIGGDPGGDGGDVSPPRIFLGGIVPPSIFESLKNILSYICILNSMKVIQKRLIQHKNTTKHTKSLNLPRASRADSRPNHISASLALPAISVAGEGGGQGGNSPPPDNAFSELCRYISKFVAIHVSRQACHLYRQSI